MTMTHTEEPQSTHLNHLPRRVRLAIIRDHLVELAVVHTINRLGKRALKHGDVAAFIRLSSLVAAAEAVIKWSHGEGTPSENRDYIVTALSLAEQMRAEGIAPFGVPSPPTEHDSDFGDFTFNPHAHQTADQF